MRLITNIVSRKQKLFDQILLPINFEKFNTFLSVINVFILYLNMYFSEYFWFLFIYTPLYYNVKKYYCFKNYEKYVMYFWYSFKKYQSIYIMLIMYDVLAIFKRHALRKYFQGPTIRTIVLTNNWEYILKTRIYRLFIQKRYRHHIMYVCI